MNKLLPLVAALAFSGLASATAPATATVRAGNAPSVVVPYDEHSLTNVQAVKSLRAASPTSTTRT